MKLFYSKNTKTSFQITCYHLPMLIIKILQLLHLIYSEDNKNIKKRVQFQRNIHSLKDCIYFFCKLIFSKEKKNQLVIIEQVK